MSASREKKKRQETLASGEVDVRAVREAEAKAKEKRSSILYTSLGILFVAAAIFLLIYNSGVFQRNKTALTVDGETYTVADVSYHYNSAYHSFMNSQNGQMAVQFGMLDPQKPLTSQGAWGGEDQTWAEFFKDQAVTNIKFIHAANKGAAEEGLTFGEEEQEILDSSIENLKAAAKEAGYSYKAYLAAMYGSTVTPDVFEKNMKAALLASKYSTAYSDSLEFTDDEVQAFYEEHKDDYDKVDGVYVTVSGSPEPQIDSEGKGIDPTQEEKDAAMEKAKEIAEEILAEVESGKDLADIASERDLPCVAREEMPNDPGIPTHWLFSADRQPGDLEVLQDEATSNYFVAQFNSRQRDEALDYSVRHILVTDANLELEEGQTGTDEMRLAKAQEILDSWDGTEDGFAALAQEYSQDGNKDEGGIYENVNKHMMVPEFENWCYEDGRKPGDTGIVRTNYGQHIMYFIGYGETPYWYHGCEGQMLSEAYNKWETELIDSVEVVLNESGMKAIA